MPPYKNRPQTLFHHPTMPAYRTPDFKGLPGIRDMFPEHFPPRRPQPPTEPRRAPQGPDTHNNYMFGVLKHNPRNASLEVFKHNHPLPDPKRWYSKSAAASFPSPTLAKDVKGTRDRVTSKPVDGERVDDRQLRKSCPFYSSYTKMTDNPSSTHRKTFLISILPLRSGRKTRSLNRLLSIDTVSTPSPTAVPLLHLPADEPVSPLWRVEGGVPDSLAYLPSPHYGVEGRLSADGALPQEFSAQEPSHVDCQPPTSI
ncbi:hypothetical protein C8R44DRAFT_932827 [Mycena epipterygia]|nr:hypothetical protein C8R44DRAFT_932827 [Mycena epipterygia]